MAVSDEFMEFVLDQLSEWGGVSSRRMFGGAGIYRDGRMFGLIANDVLYLKVGKSNRKSFIDAGSEPFKPYPDRAVTMSYYEVPPHVIEDPQTLLKWAGSSLDVQKEN